MTDGTLPLLIPTLPLTLPPSRLANPLKRDHIHITASSAAFSAPFPAQKKAPGALQVMKRAWVYAAVQGHTCRQAAQSVSSHSEGIAHRCCLDARNESQ
ncbi:hypothetical protein E2C01_054849 [Portunus trituberculatus]|uniref:Uncharacterized protein n=1 Tax=Portunus trituberculatus TaxID=210409 RepID=A0A5B7GPP5_PORTR|nr:hypothetical protein [Portunus trituberculatus]